MLSCIANFKVKEHESVFELVKQKTIVDYRNRRFQQSYFHCVTATNQVLEHPFWSNEERLRELETLTGAEVQDFLKEFLDNLLIEAFIVGNFSAEEAVKMITESLSPLQPKALEGDSKPCLCITQVFSVLSRADSHSFCLQIPEGETWVHEELGPDPDAVDSAISVYYQIGERTVDIDVRLELLCQVMDKEMYAQLRTVEQLGYIVAAVETKKWGVCGLKCLVQSVQCPQVRLEDPCARAVTVERSIWKFAWRTSSCASRRSS